MMPAFNQKPALFCLAILAAHCLAGEGYFRGLGTLAGLATSRATGVSGDGTIVVGIAGTFGGYAFRWTQEDGMIALDPNQQFDGSFAEAISRDGSTIVGSVSFPNRILAFRWTIRDGFELLGDFPGGDRASTSLAVSTDGSVISGIGSSELSHPYEVFRWTRETGLVALGDLPGGILQSAPTAISASGAVIVGVGRSESGEEAFRWTAKTGMVGLGDLPGGFFRSVATRASADGRIVVGFSLGGNEFFDGFIWTREDGMRPLIDPTGRFQQIRPTAMTPDASIILGEAIIEGSNDLLFIWDARAGFRTLRSALENEFGIDVNGHGMTGVRGISADGRTIVGSGGSLDTGSTEAWIAYLGPPPCPSDVDGDGSVGLSDLGILLRWFGTSVTGTHDRGDVNFDGDVDLQDLGLMLSAFGTTCP